MNDERTANLLKTINRWDENKNKMQFAPGMFVTKLNDDIPTIDKSKAKIPTARNVYKIIEIMQNYFRAGRLVRPWLASLASRTSAFNSR